MRILKTLLIIFLYELSKEITYEIICRKQANNVVDKYPKDYEITKSIEKSIAKSQGKCAMLEAYKHGGF